MGDNASAIAGARSKREDSCQDQTGLVMRANGVMMGIVPD
jgi:hypothetical protein